MEDLSHNNNSEEKAGSATVIAGAIIFAGLLIAGAVVYSNYGKNSPQERLAAVNGPIRQTGPANEELAANGAVLGDPKAPVTIVEFADFQCPFCARFYKFVGKTIIEEYVKTGKARFVYRDFAFLGPESQAAAEAAKCAGEQDKFWPYHDRLYDYIWENYYSKNKNGENVGAFSRDNLKKIAGESGLVRSVFDACVDSGKFSEEVKKDAEAAQKFGVNSTPTSFINGQIVVGAVPFEDYPQNGETLPGFKTMIEKELAKTDNK